MRNIVQYNATQLSLCSSEAKQRKKKGTTQTASMCVASMIVIGHRPFVIFSFIFQSTERIVDFSPFFNSKN